MRQLEDALVEMRFYVPGGVMKGQIKDSEDKVIYKDSQAYNDLQDTEESTNLENGEISQQVFLRV